MRCRDCSTKLRRRRRRYRRPVLRGWVKWVLEGGKSSRTSVSDLRSEAQIYHIVVPRGRGPHSYRTADD